MFKFIIESRDFVTYLTLKLECSGQLISLEIVKRYQWLTILELLI